MISISVNQYLISFSNFYGASSESLTITGANTNTITDITNWSTRSISEPAYLTATGANYIITVRLRGNTPPGNGGVGGYVQGTFTAKVGQTYNLHYDTRYSAVFYGTGTDGNNCIMLAAEGGYEGRPSFSTYDPPHPPRPSEPRGGNAGYPYGSYGSSLNNSGGGSGASTSGYRSGSPGRGGYAGGGGGYSGNAGTDGGFFTAGNGGWGVDGFGGNGGFGYYGGGGGGGGWDGGYAAGGYFGGGGGGGSSYIGGLPRPSVDSNSPAEVVVTNTSYGNETGGVQIRIISVVRA